jgi:hypothetical protein
MFYVGKAETVYQQKKMLHGYYYSILLFAVHSYFQISLSQLQQYKTRMKWIDSHE